MDQKIPLRRAIIWICLSTILFTGSITMAWLYFQYQKERKINDERFQITEIANLGNLKAEYLLELLALYSDQPANLHAFNIDLAEKALQMSPLIKQVWIFKKFPNALIIKYSTRKPYAVLADFENCVIDSEGYPFPLKPYLNGNWELPKIYAGVDSIEWGTPLTSPSVFLGLKLINLIRLHSLFPRNNFSIDLSKSCALGCGQKQIIVDADPIYLKLTPENFLQELANYEVLKVYLIQQQFPKRIAIDMRCSELALIEEIHG